MSHRIFFILAVILIVCIFLSQKSVLAEGVDAFAYDSKGKRDPFVPLILTGHRAYSTLENVETINDVMLEGILWDPKGGSIAILNGTILKEGDAVKNVKILKIEPRKVFLTIDNIRYEVNLKEKEEGE